MTVFARVPVAPRSRARWPLGALLFSWACSRGTDADPRRAPPPLVSVASVAPAPRLLYLPDASAAVPPSPVPAPPDLRLRPRCPLEMVDVHGAFCVDRYEASLVDAGTGRLLSPYYPPRAEATRTEYRRWQRLRAESPPGPGREMAVPAPPEWQLEARSLQPMATSVAGVIPSGYLSGEIAEQACGRAGKRLCTAEEWVTACRGEQNRQFPYGHLFEDERCNVFRATHPAGLLHGDPSMGHGDPRLNAVEEEGRPLLRPTGATPDCESKWGIDGVHDMVGNLDEWILDPDGTFLGGFYARSTRQGCDSRVEVHSYDYHDYSLGTRCCLTP